MLKLITPYCSDFGKVNVVIKHFPDTESYVLVPKIKSKKVAIYHRLYPEPDKRIFELLLVLSRVKKEVKNIELFVPYLPYARQDRENKKGEAVSADVLCGLLKSYGVKKLITYDCHFLPRAGNFVRAGLPIENKTASKILYAYAKKYFGKDEFYVVSPDEGASYFTENAQGFAMRKKRQRNKEHGLETEIHSIECEADANKKINGKNICILDDMVATGGTIIHALKHLKEKGAKKIIVGATHGVFAGEKIAKKILKSGCSRLFVANSIPSPATALSGRSKILTLPLPPID